MATHQWSILLQISILFFTFLVYLGIGFILLLATGEGADLKIRLKTVFCWPKYLIEYLIKGHPEDDDNTKKT